MYVVMATVGNTEDMAAAVTLGTFDHRMDALSFMEFTWLALRLAFRHKNEDFLEGTGFSRNLFSMLVDDYNDLDVYIDTVEHNRQVPKGGYVRLFKLEEKACT